MGSVALAGTVTVAELESGPRADVLIMTPFERFPINRYVEFEPSRADLEQWRLVVEGQVSRPGEYTLDQIKALPKVVQNVRHICIEGWDVIGKFGGARIGDFLQSVGADTTARFLALECADDYYESLDMATALSGTGPAYVFIGEPG